MIFKDNAVRTGNAHLIWDGITRPSTKDDGATEWSVKVAIPETSPEYAELHALATKALQESELKGTLPAGANWPFIAPDLEKLDDRVAGHITFNAKTRLHVPEVFDANGKQLSPMEYGSKLYAGCLVQVLVNAYYFNKSGNKGISLGLSGIMIVDSTTPAFAIAGGLTPGEIAGAFGGTAAPSPGAGGLATPGAPAAAAPTLPTVPAPAAAAPPVPNPAILDPEARLTAKAKAENLTYAALSGAGWTEAQMITAGYLTA